jgi:hypothetical protein
MPFAIGDTYMRRLIDRGLIPETAVSVFIRCTWGEVPTMEVTTLEEEEHFDMIIDCIDNTERIDHGA